MKTLLKDMKQYKREVILAPLFKMLEAGFDLLVPLVMKRIIDAGIPAGDRGIIIRMCLVLALLALVGLLCAAVAQYFSARAAVGFSTGLRHKVFEHVQTLSFKDLDHIGTSTLITRMTSDVNQIQNGVNLTLRLFMRSPFVVFGAMIMAFTIDVKAALIFAVLIPLLSIVVFGIMLYTMPLYKKVQGALDNVTSTTRENLRGVRVIRAFRREKAEEGTFYEATDRLQALQRFTGRISATMNPVTYLLLNLAIVLLLYTGAVRVNIGILTQGAVIALVNYMNQILVELVKLANLIIQMTRAAACLNRVEAVLSEGSEKEGVALTEAPSEEFDPEAPYAVEFDHVSLKYTDGAAPALSEIDFKVARGESIGIIGGTGAGKSSLMELIPGFYEATEGEVWIFGKPVSAYDVKTLRTHIGIVMQKAVLFAGTIKENLLFGREDASEEELWEALGKAQAADFVRQKDGMLEALVEQEGRNFSGGQRQRLAVARALVKDPEILILDDSASALDFATDAALRKAIRELPGEKTVFIVSQRAASVMTADRIIVLEDGRIAGLGTHEELLKDCEVYREIYESQFK